jgi:hypothetical protein
MRIQPYASDMAEGDASAPSGSTADARSRMRWVGSASAPGALGYVDIGILLAVMEVGAGVLSIRVRPALIRMMFGIQNLQTVPDLRTEIFPAHKFGQAGIEVRREGKPSYYFWTDRRSDLLAALTASGFRVSTEEQAMSYRRANRALRSAGGPR